ncbi:MAG: DUF4363 family protein [Limnochordia bacterium]|jgi:hypothetical protein
MRLLYGVAIVLVVIIGMGIHAQNYIMGTSQELKEQLIILEEQIHAEEWSAGLLHYKGITTNANSLLPNWSLLVSSHEIDALEESLSRLGSFLQIQDKKGALAEVASARAWIDAIVNKEVFNFRNIL